MCYSHQLLQSGETGQYLCNSSHIKIMTENSAFSSILNRTSILQWWFKNCSKKKTTLCSKFQDFRLCAPFNSTKKKKKKSQHQMRPATHDYNVQGVQMQSWHWNDLWAQQYCHKSMQFWVPNEQVKPTSWARISQAFPQHKGIGCNGIESQITLNCNHETSGWFVAG